jgi:SpoVK/Ycf46/Vps4 family AAA+-type ATPase
LAGRLWRACRDRARADLDGLAERIEPAALWQDLVLPARELASLRDLMRHALHRARVYEDWRVTGSARRGGGVSALFTGPSGTGKSLAAEVIATELDVDLYRVDLSQVVSKYIGETEKNLRGVFDAAERSGAVLLIDEADALFGRRSEVKDSHDRYANIEVSYLLARMETYRGLAILTTNLRANIDDAFVRRLGFIVTFPFPGQAQRRDLWRRAFGARVPVCDLDGDRLAQLNLSGGSIRNVAVHAAFRAAERASAVTMADVLAGARSEYEKLDRPLTSTELEGWPL